MIWVRTSRSSSSRSGLQLSDRVVPYENGSLAIRNLDREMDSGNYTCRSADDDEVFKMVRLSVRSTPAAATNLTVIPQSIYALITWEPPPDDGGFPLQHFVLKCVLEASHLDLEHDPDLDVVIKRQVTEMTVTVPAASTSKSLYHLRPNSTYSFMLHAVNQLGEGPDLTVTADTIYSEPEIDQAKELYQSSQRSNIVIKYMQ